MTRLSRPVAISASVGTTGRACSASGCTRTSANMPGTSRRCGLRSTIRARCVRLAMSTWGSNAWICPAKRSAGQALTVACTEVPGRKVPSAAWGTEASSHNVSSPLILNSGVPGITVCPSRARISVTTPLWSAPSTTPLLAEAPEGTPNERNRCCAAPCSSRAPAD